MRAFQYPVSPREAQHGMNRRDSYFTNIAFSRSQVNTLNIVETNDSEFHYDLCVPNNMHLMI